MKLGCNITYQWYPIAADSDLPWPAMHIYPNEVAMRRCEHKIDSNFGLEAVLLALDEILNQIKTTTCNCDSLALLRHGCCCGKI